MPDERTVSEVVGSNDLASTRMQCESTENSFARSIGVLIRAKKPKWGLSMFRPLIVLVLTPLVLAAADPKAGEFPDETISVGNAKREYRLVVPKSVDLSRPAPLVFAFHGMIVDSKDLMPKYSQLNGTAAKHQFIVVYPAAQGASWGLRPEKVKADLAFFDTLLKELEGRYNVDRNRVYVLGMSNGAYFANVVAKERPNVVAAMAGHSGGLDVKTLAFGVNAERKFPLLIIHGENDKILPLKVSQATKERYAKEGHEVEYLEVPNLGHAWATRIDVNEKIWKFFAARPIDEKSK